MQITSFYFPGGGREEIGKGTNYQQPINPYIPNPIGEIKSPKANVKEESE